MDHEVDASANTKYGSESAVTSHTMPILTRMS